MKWYFLFWFAHASVGGPFDTQAGCIDALKEAIATNGGAIDPGFHQGAKAGGLCFQAVHPEDLK